mmetsp:Transcript_40785/g.95289  ORF Transcript_40785/g.95289 Transcript_40785/m.95289 type:complete len:349 (+) Transcript_40785:1-1047(+)
MRLAVLALLVCVVVLVADASSLDVELSSGRRTVGCASRLAAAKANKLKHDATRAKELTIISDLFKKLDNLRGITETAEDFENLQDLQRKYAEVEGKGGARDLLKRLRTALKSAGAKDAAEYARLKRVCHNVCKKQVNRGAKMASAAKRKAKTASRNHVKAEKALDKAKGQLIAYRKNLKAVAAQNSVNKVNRAREIELINAVIKKAKELDAVKAESDIEESEDNDEMDDDELSERLNEAKSRMDLQDHEALVDAVTALNGPHPETKRILSILHNIKRRLLAQGKKDIGVHKRAIDRLKYQKKIVVAATQAKSAAAKASQEARLHHARVARRHRATSANCKKRMRLYKA